MLTAATVTGCKFELRQMMFGILLEMNAIIRVLNSVAASKSAKSRQSRISMPPLTNLKVPVEAG